MYLRYRRFHIWMQIMLIVCTIYSFQIHMSVIVMTALQTNQQHHPNNSCNCNKIEFIFHVLTDGSNSNKYRQKP